MRGISHAVPSVSRRTRDRQLPVLYASLFVVMAGYASALVVLPYHAQQVDGLRTASPDRVALHVGLLTSVYALAQLLAGPFVGRLAARVGRPIVLIGGLLGIAITQAAFGLTTSLAALYLLRFAGGVAAAGMVVAATTFVAERSSDAARTRAMAAYGTSVSLGLVAGPALAAALSSPDVDVRAGWVRIDGYSMPFLFSALVTLAVLAYAAPRLRAGSVAERSTAELATTEAGVPPSGPRLRWLLGLVAISQCGLAVFEATFVLYARDRLALTAAQLSWGFIVCGLVMAVLQLPAASLLARVASPLTQVTIGFGLMGIGVASILAVRTYGLVLLMIGILAAGAALIIPNLASMVSKDHRGGTVLAIGWKSSASSLGQFVGPVAGGILISVQRDLPFLVAGAALLATAAGLTRLRHSIAARSGAKTALRR